MATMIIVSFSLFIWFSRSISRVEFSLSMPAHSQKNRNATTTIIHGTKGRFLIH